VKDSHDAGAISNVYQEFEMINQDARIAGLSHSGARMLNTPNAGGSSIWSEVLSFEMFRGLYGSQLVRSEMEILYGCHSKITDFSVLLFGRHIGVSVTRAMKFKGIFTEEDGIQLLRKKLNGIIRSTAGVIREHRWEKQILHMWAERDYIEDVIQRAYMEVEAEYKANTLVFVTIARDVQYLYS